MSVARPQPRDKRGAQRSTNSAHKNVRAGLLKQQRSHEQRCLHSLARDHQQREEEHACERLRAGLQRR